MTAVVAFRVAGAPVPQGSVRAYVVAGRAQVTHGRSSGLHPWRAAIAAEAASIWPDGPTRGAWVLELEYHFARPAGHYGTGRNAGQVRASAPTAKTTRPDVDKLERAVLDALTGVLWVDDSQVVRVTHSKAYHDVPALHVRAAELGS